MTLITAHEGSEGSISNTLDSVQAGIDSEADIIEVDVRSTKDNVALLSHGEYIVTTEDKKIKIADFTLNELLEMEKNKIFVNNGSTGKITRLVEVFELIRKNNKVLNLDVKDFNSISSLVKAVKNKNMLDHVFVSGCERESASYLSKNHPEFQVLFNVGESFRYLAERDPQAAIKTICREAVQAGCCGLNIPYQYCSQDLIEYAHLRFLPVSVWTIDDTDTMRKFLDMGVYSITTNRPGKLRKLISN